MCMGIISFETHHTKNVRITQLATSLSSILFLLSSYWSWSSTLLSPWSSQNSPQRGRLPYWSPRSAPQTRAPRACSSPCVVVVVVVVMEVLFKLLNFFENWILPLGLSQLFPFYIPYVPLQMEQQWIILCNWSWVPLVYSFQAMPDFKYTCLIGHA